MAQRGVSLAGGPIGAFGPSAIGAGVNIGQAAIATATSSTIVAFTAVAAAGIAAAIALKAFDSAVQPLIDRYAQYNPEIAFAQAMAEVRGIFGDMRRANESGPGLARYIEVRSQLEQEWKDAELTLLQELLPIATEILKLMTDVLTVFNRVSTGVEILPGLDQGVAMLARIIVRWFNLVQEQQINPVVDRPFDPRSITVPLGL